LRNERKALAALLGLTLLLPTGCGLQGGHRVAVSGAVTLDGQPVEGGAIVFLPEGNGTNDRPKTGVTIEAGKYTIPAEKGPALGKYRVEIRWQKPTGKKIPSDDPPNLMDETRQVIPDKYNSRSDLTCEVQPGKNTFDFALTSK
jgi:hypothetical protein